MSALFDGESAVEGVSPVFGKYSIGEFTSKDTSGEAHLAVDIGATNTRFAIFRTDAIDCILSARFRSGSKEIFMKQLDKVMALAQERGIVIASINVGAAGPVAGNRAAFLTNLGWQLDARELKVGSPMIYNDFEATGYGIRFLDHSNENQIVQLNKVKPTDGGTVAIIGPGTGLGMAIVVGDRVVPSEGGHMGMVVRTEEELRLAEFLRQMMRTDAHPDWEAVVSGAGITNIYRFVMNDPKLVVDPAWITSSRETGARTATDLFIELFARAASDLALVSKSAGGLYITGGIAPKLRDKLLPHFTDTFLKNPHKSIRAGVLEKVPVFLVVEERTPLIGLAHLSMSAKDK